MPLSYANLFRLIVMLALAAWVFLMYCAARGTDATFGWSTQKTVACGLFALAMLVPMLWSVGVPEFPEALNQHRKQRRWHDGQCPNCTYPIDEKAAGTSCPECGAILCEPVNYRFTRRTFVRALVLMSVAWIFGCLVAEGWCRLDEWRFHEEVIGLRERDPQCDYMRQCAWPNRDVVFCFIDDVYSVGRE